MLATNLKSLSRPDYNTANVIELEQTDRLHYLHTKVRDKTANKRQFTFYADQIIRLLLEKSLERLNFEGLNVTTPVGETYEGKQFAKPLCGVSVVRAGESMENELRRLDLNIPIGKILIQRDPTTKLPKLYYSKLPDNVEKFHVLLFEPMLATGGSAICALDVMTKAGVKPENITFVNLLCSPEGLQKVTAQFPDVTIVTSSIEQRLNEHAFMIPGIGDFGDRYFGTTDLGAV
ncbi:uracil phosphoribosyltransferase [Pseudoalteromonas rubra]|uniref:Uracil phosphoribosyltransferase n=2 Tax=Pseudoalteromonas rubra TaxID=43658 RepID=A0A0U3I3L6_9GAMM|nr:uracil phosphoribosyltransferase [Pseudoalteromonas rubra]ALU44534.1 uracil phosphoribosyltransferase [Pseudoalteromonas rubra]